MGIQLLGQPQSDAQMTAIGRWMMEQLPALEI